MKELFYTKKQKIFLVVNITLMLLYFIMGIADFVFYTTFSIVTSMVIGLIIPAVILYFTAPRTNGGCKITYSIWGIIMSIYYIYRGNQQIKGNEYLSKLTNIIPETIELRTRMIIAIVLSIVVFIIGLEIIYCKKQKKRIKNEQRRESTVYVLNIYDKDTNEIRREAKSVNIKEYPLSKYSFNNEYFVIDRNGLNGNEREYVHKYDWDKITNQEGNEYSFEVCIYDESTRNINKRILNIDVNRFPVSKFAEDNIYYAIEVKKEGKKTRVYYPKSKWEEKIKE